jgi:hypothetical protein
MTQQVFAKQKDFKWLLIKAIFSTLIITKNEDWLKIFYNRSIDSLNLKALDCAFLVFFSISCIALYGDLSATHMIFDTVWFCSYIYIYLLDWWHVIYSFLVEDSYSKIWESKLNELERVGEGGKTFKKYFKTFYFQRYFYILN